MSEILKTKLHSWHRENNGVLVPFAGWEMPIRYSSVLKEHRHVRETCGIFDVSHMGEVRVKGSDTWKFLQNLLINDTDKLVNATGQYTAMCQPDGGMIDDLIIYRLSEEEAFLCINAGNIEKDVKWIRENAAQYSVAIFDESSMWSQIAIQGPKSLDIFEKMSGEKVGLEYMQIRNVNCVEGSKLARTGYTGELGLEWYIPNNKALETWEGLLRAGAQPIGLGARDTLRLESCYLLYGQDMDEKVSALEAGLGWATRLETDFIGQASLKKQKEAGLTRRIAAFKMSEKGVPRSGMTVMSNDNIVGKDTSGSILPTLDAFGGLMLLDKSIKVGDEVEVDIRGQKRRAMICKKPLYSAKVK